MKNNTSEIGNVIVTRRVFDAKKRPDEVIDIGEDIEIRVCRIRKHQVALSIKAPRNIKIMRRELAKRIESSREKKNNDEK